MMKLLLICFVLWTLLSLYFAKSSISSIYTPQWLGPSPLWYEPVMVTHALHLIRSYRELTGKDLVSKDLALTNPEAAAKELFFSPRVIVSHGIQAGPEGPILNYGNARALRAWKASWEELTSTASIYTADVDNREKRAEVMQKVTENGFVTDYSGIRIAFDKTKFRIEGVDIWNVVDNDSGLRIGQAATFSEMTLL